jgi:uncharacterized membrane protein YkvA (DUF1232 family)
MTATTIDLPMSEPFLEALERVMEQARARVTDAGTLAREARRLAREARLQALPAFVERQMYVLESMTRLVEDPENGLDAQARDRVLGALAYAVEPADLLPDAMPELGLLDDAIAIDRVAGEVEAQLAACSVRRRARDRAARRAMLRRMERRCEQRARCAAPFAPR